MIPIQGLFETHLTVGDLARSVQFYREVVGLEFAYEVPARQVAFFWVGGRGHGMLGLWAVGSAPLRMRLHLAFAVATPDVLAAPTKLKAAHVTPLGFNGEPVDEPVVTGWMPALSLYFSDPDGHSIEYLAMLDDPPRPEMGVVPYSRWMATR